MLHIGQIGLCKQSRLRSAQIRQSDLSLHCLPPTSCGHRTVLHIILYQFYKNSSNFVVPFELQHDKTNRVSMCPAKTQISLGIRQVWSESSLGTQWVAKDPSFLHTDSEDSDQTGPMSRLIWVFAGRTLTLLVLSCRSSFLSVFP